MKVSVSLVGVEVVDGDVTGVMRVIVVALAMEKRR